MNRCGPAATNSATVLLSRGHAGALGVGANHEEERDGYGAHYRYGSVSNGKVAVLAAVPAAIVTYEVIR